MFTSDIYYVFGSDVIIPQRAQICGKNIANFSFICQYYQFIQRGKTIYYHSRFKYLVKELSHLNKYLIKYKYHLLSGILFIIISNVFAILPAQIVRYSVDIISNELSLYGALEGLNTQSVFADSFAVNIFICGLAIVIMALLRGLFLF